MHKYAVLEDTVHFWFGSNDTGGSGDDGASPAADVRLAGAAADAAPVLSPTPALLTDAGYSAGCYEVAVAATAGNGFAAGNEYAVFCTLAVDSENPTGFVGSFTLLASGKKPYCVVDGSDYASVADGHLTAAKFGADCITNAKIADDAIAVENIKDAALTAAKLAADCITNAKIADDAIAVENIKDAAITAAKLAADCITAAKYDESTAFPLKADDSGATLVARTGADGDTLEILSDEIALIAAGDATEAKQNTIVTHLTDVKGTGFAKDTHSLVNLVPGSAVNLERGGQEVSIE